VFPRDMVWLSVVTLHAGNTEDNNNNNNNKHEIKELQTTAIFSTAHTNCGKC